MEKVQAVLVHTMAGRLWCDGEAQFKIHRYTLKVSGVKVKCYFFLKVLLGPSAENNLSLASHGSAEMNWSHYSCLASTSL